MEILSSILPIILYIVAIILIIVLIIIGVRVLEMLNRVDKIIEDVEEKKAAFDKAFNTMNKAVTGVANISDSVVFGVTNVASKVFNRKRKEEDNIYE